MSRLALIAVAIILIGFATAVAGPIMFVALIAGPIAQRIVGHNGGGIMAAGLVGSIIVGLFVEISTIWLEADLKYVGALLILILVLLFRPQGILGRRERIG